MWAQAVTLRRFDAANSPHLSDMAAPDLDTARCQGSQRRRIQHISDVIMTY